MTYMDLGDIGGTDFPASPVYPFIAIVTGKCHGTGGGDGITARAIIFCAGRAFIAVRACGMFRTGGPMTRNAA